MNQRNTSICNLREKFLLGTFSAACSHRSSDFLLAPAPEAELTRPSQANDGPTPACPHPSNLCRPLARFPATGSMEYNNHP